MRIPPETQRLLLPREVMALFGVGPVALCRWGNSGRMPYVTTPGGNRRYPEAEVLALLRAGDTSMIVPDCAAGEVAPSGAPRPAAGAARASMPAGRQEDAAPGLRFGGFLRPGAAFPPDPPSEGGRQ